MSNTLLVQECLKKLSKLEKLLKNKKNDVFFEKLVSIIYDHAVEKESKKKSESLQKKLFSLLANQISKNEYQHLFHYLHSDVLNYANEYIAILDEQSKILSINDRHARVVGYDDPQDVLGLSYSNFKGAVSEKADLFRGQDLSVLNTKNPIVFLSYYPFSDGRWRLLYGEKACILGEKSNAIGVFSKSKDITGTGLVDMSRFLIEDQLAHFGKMINKSFTYYVTKENDIFDLSRKEKEVLFYFIRGKTSKEIADILYNAKRTIDMHLENIKLKLNVASKSDLIEKAIIHGYMTEIPESLLGGKHVLSNI